MAPHASSLPTVQPKRGPTVATLRAIEAVLRQARAPLSRYAIRQALDKGISQALLDEALDYMAEHAMVYDEGPGGQVAWIQTTAKTRRRLGTA